MMSYMERDQMSGQPSPQPSPYNNSLTRLLLLRSCGLRPVTRPRSSEFRSSLSLEEDMAVVAGKLGLLARLLRLQPKGRQCQHQASLLSAARPSSQQ